MPPMEPATTQRDHPWGQIFALAMIVPPVIAGAYLLASNIADGSEVVSLKQGWEEHIPFVPSMVGPYLSLYPLMVVGIGISRSRRELWRLVWAMLLGTAIAVTAFVLFPTGVPRSGTTPEQGVFELIFEDIHRLDGSACAAPSLHVILAVVLWVHFAAIVRSPWRWLVHGWFALLVASTLLTYQHQVVDVLSGGAVAAVCVLVLGVGGSRSQIRFWRRFRSRRKSRNAPGPNSQSAVTTPNDTPVQVPRSQ